MRQILIDHARRRAARAEGRAEPLPGEIPLLDDILNTIRGTSRVDILDLNNALEELKRLHKRQWEVVTLQFFGGLQWAEIAACLNVATDTVEKDWQAARALLYRSAK